MVAKHLNSTRSNRKSYRDLPKPTVREHPGGLVETLELGEYVLRTAEELENLQPVIRMNPDGTKSYLIPILRMRAGVMTFEEMQAEDRDNPITEIYYPSAIKRLKDKIQQGLWDAIS